MSKTRSVRSGDVRRRELLKLIRRVKIRLGSEKRQSQKKRTS